MKKEIARIPIIGVEEKDQGKTVTKVYMYSDPERKIQHLSLWEELGSPEDISFTTSIEGFTMDVSVLQSYLIIPDIIFRSGQESRYTCYLPIGLGSDIDAFYSEHALSKKFTNEGKEIIKSIFNIDGVENHIL